MPSTAFDRFAQGFMKRADLHYLDAAATSLMPLATYEALGQYFTRSCANPHTDAHLSGRATTQAIEDARAALAKMFRAPADQYATLFVGSGSTAALNRAMRIVRGLEMRGRDLVIVSGLEHHSNHLPWTESGNTVFVPCLPDGAMDMRALRDLVRENGRRLRAVCASAASNVTGAVSPVSLIAEIAHSAGALCVVDAAQAAPHLPVYVAGDAGPAAMGLDRVDLLAISGHKFFAPGSPGVLFGARGLFENRIFGDVGGGTVESVSYGARADYMPTAEAREEAGTPNVPGVLALGLACLQVERAGGMRAVEQHDQAMTKRLLAGLRSRPKVVVYGGDLPGGEMRVGTVAFNLVDVPHGIVAAALDDRFRVAVRNQCFCAQPYVRALLAQHPPAASTCGKHGYSRPGMVRASLGPWSTQADLDALFEGIDWIQRNAAALCSQYRPMGDGSWTSSRRPSADACFSLRALLR
jgi:cysteine desulfurase / selenocysteine lyase